MGQQAQDTGHRAREEVGTCSSSACLLQALQIPQSSPGAPGSYPDHSALSPSHTWPAGARKGLPEVSAVSMGWAGSRCTGIGHDTTRFHVHSVAGRKQGWGSRRCGAKPYPLRTEPARRETHVKAPQSLQSQPPDLMTPDMQTPQKTQTLTPISPIQPPHGTPNHAVPDTDL